jgi:hypothetical protein
LGELLHLGPRGRSPNVSFHSSPSIGGKAWLRPLTVTLSASPAGAHP